MTSQFPTTPKLIALTQLATLNRSGLVADCIFKPVKTPCAFKIVDWSNEQNGLQFVDDYVSCKTDAKEVDADAYSYLDASLKDHALSQVLDECCVVDCEDQAATQARIQMGKTRQLINKLLINREREAIALATDLTKYTDNSSNAPSHTSAVVDGGRFALSLANFNDPTFALLKWFQPIQSKALVKRNIAVMSQATLDGFLSHPNFLGAGCIVDPLTTPDKVAALLGVEKICIADANYNNGIGSAVNMAKFWPEGYILFTSSYDLVTSDESQLTFGITAYDQGFNQFTWIDPHKGKGQGATMQKVGHDLTPIVLSYKAATLVVIS